MCMPTNLAVDDQLLDQAGSVGGYRTIDEHFFAMATHVPLRLYRHEDVA